MAIITRRKVATLLIVFLAAFAALSGYLYYLQDSLIYHPLRELEATPGNIGLDYRAVALKTSDGLKISGWYITASQRRGVVLFFHGNGGNISHRLESIRIFNNIHMDVLIIDYRGYGQSEGSPSKEGTYKDAEAAWDYLVQTMHVSPDRIIIFGRSLGSAVAAEMALRHQAAGLILESGFTSIKDIGKELFPYLPVSLIVRHKYDTISKVDRIEIPKLIVHSPQDDIIPYTHGIALYHRAAAPKAFLKISGGHDNGFLLSGQYYTSGIELFISECLGKRRDYFSPAAM